MRQIFLTSEVAQEGPPLQRPMVADGTAQHRIFGFERIKHCPRGDRGWNLERDFATDVSEVAEMSGKNYADHG